MPLLRSSKVKLRNFLYPTLLAGVIGGFFFVPRLIKITEIVCISQFGPCSPGLVDSLSALNGKSLSEVKTQASSFLAESSGVKDFSVRFKFPATVLVAVLEAKARFAVKGGEVYAGLNEEGEVLWVGSETPLPYVIIPSRPPNPGEKVGAKTLFALKLQERLYSAYQIRSGVLEADYL